MANKLFDLIKKILPKTNQLEDYKIEIDFINTFSRKGQEEANYLEDLLFHMNIPTHFYDQRENYFYVSLIPRKDLKFLKGQKHLGRASINDVYLKVKAAGFNPKKPELVR